LLGSALGIVNVGFAPQSDRLLRCREMTLCANIDQSALQQKRSIDDLVASVVNQSRW